ncbi:hypothetical protein Tco_0668355 [Tanacetum coccineum]
MDAFTLTPFYHAFLITADVPDIYMQEFWATTSLHRSSMRFTINKNNVSLDVDIFRDILQFCPKIPGQVFEDLPLEQDILSFIRDLGHTRDITYLTDVNVDYLHQPWIAFSTVINKCLSGKETRMNKIRLSCAQILWDAKKTNNMSYPRFTKIIIDYFISKDPSISRRNKMFWHTARDDTLFTSMRCISRHKDTQVYGTILLTELTNQAMVESKAYQTYYAFASREKAPKPKYIRKKADSKTSPKKKPVQATKCTRLKSKAKVTKPNKNKQHAKKIKAKGLDVLSEVALTKAEQIKLVTKRNKKDFPVSQASGSGDGVDTQSKVLDEQQPKTSSTDEGTGAIPGVPDVPLYESKSNKESWGDTEDEDNDDDDGDNDDDGDSDDHDDDSEDDEEKLDDEETMDDEEDDEVIEELYDDVNVNLGNDDIEITDADQGTSEQQNVSQESGFEQEEEDAHVTLTPVLDVQKVDEPVQSSSVSSDFTSKLLNLENPSPSDNEIASLMETSACHTTTIPEITSSFTTTTPPPPLFFNPILQQQILTFTTTTSTNPIVTLPEIPNFASGFKFDQRYLASKMKEVVDVAIQLQTNKLREVAQAENKEFLYQDEDPSAGSDRWMKRRKSGKDAESSKGSRPKEKKSSSTSKDASQSQHKSSRKSVHAEEPSHTVEDSGMQQDQEFVTGDNDEQPAEKEFTKADWFKKPERPPTPDPDWEPPTSFDKFNDTSFDFSAFVLNRVKILNLTQEIPVGPAFNLLKGTCKNITELEYHLEECSKAKTERIDWHNRENKPYPFDLRKPLPLIQDHRGCQIIPKDYFINKDLEYLKGGDLSRRYSTSATKTKAATYELKWVEDLVQNCGVPCNLTSSKDVYSRRRIIAVTKLTIMKKYDYGHLEEIEVRRDDQQLYTFKEGDFKRLRLQDIEDMLLLLKRVEDLQLGIKSYQQNLNLTKPDTYRSNLRNKTAYTSHSDPHGIIYVDQFKRKRLMRTDELHKFSDEKGSGYGSGYRQAALLEEVDVESRDVRWWKEFGMISVLMEKDNMVFVIFGQLISRSKDENKGRVPTEMELVLEQTQQGTSYEVSVSVEGVEELKRQVKLKGEKKEALFTLRQKPSQYICCRESQR